jgi:predicted NUDIX family NTP pyrophosphohydrolase
MKKQSAGLLLYRKKNATIEVLLAHPGGPFWAKKDAGAWSIPKGEFTDEEEPLTAARREFAEELGTSAPEGDVISLGSIRQSSGKMVHIWAQEADFDPSSIHSNQVLIEWPPKSGEQQSFPEVDRAGWFWMKTAQRKLVKGQVPFIEKLAKQLGMYLEEPEPTIEQTSLF